MKRMTHRQLAGCCLLMLAFQPACAQTAGSIQQVDAVAQRRSLEQSSQLVYQTGDAAPEIYPGESADVGPQSVLRLKPRKQWFEAVLDSQYFHTDNMFLERDNRVATGVLVSTAQIALAPTPYQLGSGVFSPRLGYRQQWFDFLEYSSHTPSLNTYDFNAQTFFTDERWTHGNWSAGAGLDYTRLLSTSAYRQFYAEYAPRWDLQRQVPLCPNTVISLTYQGTYHVTDAPQFGQPQASFYDRLDQAFLATCNYSPCPNVIVQPFYRFQYTHFTANTHREDYLNSAGLGVYYFFCPQASVRAFLSYDRRESTLDLAEYHKLEAGAGLNFTLRF